MKKGIIAFLFGCIIGTFTVAGYKAFGYEQEQTLAPEGFIEFCSKRPDQCIVQEPITIPSDWRNIIEIEAVNKKINKRIKYTPEKLGEDEWFIGIYQGDCEEYVLAKRDILIRMGFPISALRIGFVADRRNTGHAVLLVDLEHGTFVLDSNHDGVYLKDYTAKTYSYRFVKESTYDPYLWVKSK